MASHRSRAQQCFAMPRSLITQSIFRTFEPHRFLVDGNWQSGIARVSFVLRSRRVLAIQFAFVQRVLWLIKRNPKNADSFVGTTVVRCATGRMSGTAARIHIRRFCIISKLKKLARFHGLGLRLPSALSSPLDSAATLGFREQPRACCGHPDLPKVDELKGNPLPCYPTFRL